MPNINSPTVHPVLFSSTVSAHEGPEQAAIHDGRPVAAARHSGPRGRLLSAAAGLPGSPRVPHAGSRARSPAAPRRPG